jgi:hypothetical protein
MNLGEFTAQHAHAHSQHAYTTLIHATLIQHNNTTPCEAAAATTTTYPVVDGQGGVHTAR